jgi:glycosyltransferase involved in cell wall biosynthesis
MPKISIVTPSFNQARYLRRTIESVLRQDVDLEYIIIDGCSNDGSADILRDYQNRARVIIEKDNGQTDAIAKGFAMATGDVLAWLNSDDMYLPGALSQVLQAYEQGHEFFYGHVFIVDAEDALLRKRAAISADFNDLYYGRYIIPQEATFFSRRLYRESGGVDRAFQYAMDYDLWLRLALLQRPKRLNTFLSCFRYHQEQKSSRRPDLYTREVQMARVKSRGTYPESLVKSSSHRASLLIRKLYSNIVISGVRTTIADSIKKKRGRLP